MKFFVRLLLFLIINFGALGIGTFLMANGPESDWYLNLNKAPWTPPGWVFGFAWTTIMICFSIYMAKLTEYRKDRDVVILFLVQFILNVSWNYIFFNQHLVAFGLVTIISLLVVVSLIAVKFHKVMKLYTLLILPYIVWLAVACSLNGFIFFNN